MDDMEVERETREPPSATEDAASDTLRKRSLRPENTPAPRDKSSRSAASSPPPNSRAIASAALDTSVAGTIGRIHGAEPADARKAGTRHARSRSGSE
jgi:hypothetical protein